MPDEVIATTTTPGGTTGTTTETEPTFDIANYVNTDGTFKEGYKEALVPEELRSNKFYDIFHDIQGVFKAAGNQAVTLGKYGTTKGVLPINERSSPFEKEAFRSVMGIPKDSSGYKYTPPEDLPITPEQQKEVFDAFNKSDYTQAQVDTAMNLYNTRVMQAIKQNDELLAQKVSDAENKIRGKWGDKYDERLNLSKSFITKMTGHLNPDEYDELFGEEKETKDEAGNIIKIREGGINSAEFSPIRAALLDLFANIEEKYGIEDSAITSESGSVPLGSIRDQIAELENTPGFMDGKLKSSLDPKERDKHEEIMRKRDILYSKL